MVIHLLRPSSVRKELTQGRRISNLSASYDASERKLCVSVSRSDRLPDGAPRIGIAFGFVHRVAVSEEGFVDLAD